MPKDPNWKPITYRTPEQKERDKRLALKKKAKETGAWKEGTPFKSEYIKPWLDPPKKKPFEAMGLSYPKPVEAMGIDPRQREARTQKGTLWVEQQEKKYGIRPSPSQIQSYEAQFVPGLEYPEGSHMRDLGFRTQKEYTEAQRYGFKYGPHPGKSVPRGSLVITTPEGEPYARFYGSKAPDWVENAIKQGRYAESPYGAPTTGIYETTQQYPGIKDYKKYYGEMAPTVSYGEQVKQFQAENDAKWNEWWDVFPSTADLGQTATSAQRKKFEAILHDEGGTIDKGEEEQWKTYKAIRQTLQDKLNTMAANADEALDTGSISESDYEALLTSATEQARWILNMPVDYLGHAQLDDWLRNQPDKFMPQAFGEGTPTQEGEWGRANVPLSAGAETRVSAKGRVSGEPTTAEGISRNPQEIYYAMLPKFPSPAMKEYYYQSYAPVYREFLNTLGMEEVTNEEFLERWKIFLTRYAWENKYMARPPRMRGEYPSQFQPPTRHLNY